MRLFIGIEPDGEVREALGAWQARLRAAGVSGDWQAADNLHMTLAFIGEWDDPDQVPLPPAAGGFTIRLAGVGVFQRARVLYASAAPCAPLDALAADVRRCLVLARVPCDPMPFVPHITLLRKPVLPEAPDVLALPLPAIAMRVSGACLYRSERVMDRMRYTVIRKNA